MEKSTLTPEQNRLVRALLAVLGDMKFGTLSLTVQSGKVVRFEKVESIKLESIILPTEATA